MILEAMITTLREMHAAYIAVHPHVQIPPEYEIRKPEHVEPGDLIMPHSWARSSVPWAMVLETGSPPRTSQIMVGIRDSGSQHFGTHQDMRIAAHVGSDHFACFWVESWEWQRITEDQLLATMEAQTNGQH